MVKRESPARKRAAPPPKPLTREQMMDRQAARDMAQMDAVNRKPIDLALLEAEPWTGGGFTWNGQLIRGARR
jgi:hypothetical protein